MGWQTRLTGSVRMSAAAARRLLALPVDFHDQSRTFAAYTHGEAIIDARAPKLVFDLGWASWRLRAMMRILAATKDLDRTDRLEHHQPTYDAWFEHGVFFLERGRWAYVGAGPMVHVSGVDRRAVKRVVGPEAPTLADVREWTAAGPVALAVRLVEEGLELDTTAGATYRCEPWDLPTALAYNVHEAPLLEDGGATLVFATGERLDTADVCLDRIR